MPDLSNFEQTDTETGRWQVLRPAEKPGDKPIRVCVRSIHSEVVRREDVKLDKKYRAQIVAGSGYLDPQLQDEKDIILCSRAILVGWEGVTDTAGKDVPFTPTTVQDILKRYPQMRREIFTLARTDENFRPAEQVAEEQKAMAGNS